MHLWLLLVLIFGPIVVALPMRVYYKRRQIPPEERTGVDVLSAIFDALSMFWR